MEESRETFLKAVQNNDTARFLQVMELNTSKAEHFDISEFMLSLSKQQLESFWDGLMALTTTAFVEMEAEEDDATDSQTQAILMHVVSIAMVTIKQDPDWLPPQVFDTVVLLHAVLLTLPESMNKLQYKIALLCKSWWLAKREHRSDVILQTLVYFLQKSFGDDATAAGVKHIWTLHEALQEVDLENQSSQELKSLLHKVPANVAFLKIAEGRRFVSFLFSLSTTVVDDLHRTIKSQLGTCPKAWLGWYGEIYFRAWALTSGELQEKVENRCIQDLMFHAIHAHGVGGHSPAVILRSVLKYTHQQKKRKGVDEMLLRLYGPIMWRSLKVANADIRANALTLLIEAFPIYDSEAPIDQIDALLQKQLDIINELLEDPCPDVRVIAVQGVCRIVSVFWETVPVDMMRILLTKLVTKIVWDSTSAEVRLSVVKGLTFLLDNPLSHPTLKVLLPAVGDFLHDASERVRIALVELLIKVKGIRAIQFWSVSPMEHLLSRLAEDNSPVVRRIVKLIHDSFLPLDQPRNVKVTRCVVLQQSNVAAARRFFLHAGKQMNLTDITKYISMLCRCILETLRQERIDDSSNMSLDNEDKENSSLLDLTADDTDTLCGLIDIVTILLAVSKPLLQKNGNREMTQKLYGRLSAVLPEICRFLQDSRCMQSITLLASELPAEVVPHVSRSSLSKLKCLEAACTPDDYGVLINCICNWGRVDDVLEVIEDWLKRGFTVDDNTTAEKTNVKRRKSVTFKDIDPANPLLAIKFISCLLNNKLRRLALVNADKELLASILQQLKASKLCIEHRLQSEGGLSEQLTDEVLLQAWQMYHQFRIFYAFKNSSRESDQRTAGNDKASRAVHSGRRHGRGVRGQDTQEEEERAEDGMSECLSDLTQLMAWAIEGVLPRIRVDHGATKTGQKRGPAESTSDFAFGLIQIMLHSASTMVLIDKVDKEWLISVAEFAEKCLLTGAAEHLLCDVLKLMTHVLDLQMFSDRSLNDEGLRQEVVVPNALSHILSRTASLITDSHCDTQKLLAKLKPSLSEILRLYYCDVCKRENEDKIVMATIMSAVVAELKNTVKQEDESEELCTAPLSSCLISVISKRTTTLQVFVAELSEYIRCGAVEDGATFEAVTRLLDTLTQGKHSDSDRELIKRCVTELQQQLEQHLREKQVNEESEQWRAFSQCKETLKKCLLHIPEEQREA